MTQLRITVSYKLCCTKVGAQPATQHTGPGSFQSQALWGPLLSQLCYPLSMLSFISNHKCHGGD